MGPDRPGTEVLDIGPRSAGLGGQQCLAGDRTMSNVQLASELHPGITEWFGFQGTSFQPLPWAVTSPTLLGCSM